MRKGSETKRFLHVRKGRDTSITWTQSPQFTEWKGEEKEKKWLAKGCTQLLGCQSKVITETPDPWLGISISPWNRHLIISSVQSLSHVRLFATPWTAACQASLSIINSQSLLRLMSIELMMPSNHLISCYPLLLLPSVFPSIRSFPMSQFFTSGGQSIGVSASASVLPMNIQTDFL